MQSSGVAAYLQRQEKARTERERLKSVHSNQTKKWENRVTVPKAPILGTLKRSSRRYSSASILNYKPRHRTASAPTREPPRPPRVARKKDEHCDEGSEYSIEGTEDEEESELDNFALLKKLLKS